MHVGAECHTCVGVGTSRENLAVPGPVHELAAGNIARPDREVGSVVHRVEQAVQLLGCVAAVGVHLDDDRVIAVQAPFEAGEVGLAEAVLLDAVHHMDTTLVVALGEFVGYVAGAVGTGIIDDQHVDARHGCLHPRHNSGKVLALVVRGDDDQCARAVGCDNPALVLAGRISATRCHHAPPTPLHHPVRPVCHRRGPQKARE